MRELGLRLVSATVILPLVGLAVWHGDWVFDVFLLALFLGLSAEWRGLIAPFPTGPRRVLHLAGVFYILIAVLAAHGLRNGPAGLDAMIWLVLVVIATDVGAYAAGRAIGGPKLLPAVSPNKTWAGLIGGMAAAGAVAYGAAVPAGTPSVWLAVGGAGLAVLAQAGDLLESGVKRAAGVKDSGRLIPGHGGLLDRLDGFLAATPGLWLYGAGVGHSVVLGLPG